MSKKNVDLIKDNSLYLLEELMRRKEGLEYKSLVDVELVKHESLNSFHYKRNDFSTAGVMLKITNLLNDIKDGNILSSNLSSKPFYKSSVAKHLTKGKGFTLYYSDNFLHNNVLNIEFENQTKIGRMFSLIDKGLKINNKNIDTISQNPKENFMISNNYHLNKDIYLEKNQNAFVYVLENSELDNKQKEILGEEIKHYCKSRNDDEYISETRYVFEKIIDKLYFTSLFEDALEFIDKNIIQKSNILEQNTVVNYLSKSDYFLSAYINKLLDNKEDDYSIKFHDLMLSTLMFRDGFIFENAKDSNNKELLNEKVISLYFKIQNKNIKDFNTLSREEIVNLSNEIVNNDLSPSVTIGLMQSLDLKYIDFQKNNNSSVLMKNFILYLQIYSDQYKGLDANNFINVSHTKETYYLKENKDIGKIITSFKKNYPFDFNIIEQMAQTNLPRVIDVGTALNLMINHDEDFKEIKVININNSLFFKNLGFKELSIELLLLDCLYQNLFKKITDEIFGKDKLEFDNKIISFTREILENQSKNNNLIKDGNYKTEDAIKKTIKTKDDYYNFNEKANSIFQNFIIKIKDENNINELENSINLINKILLGTIKGIAINNKRYLNITQDYKTKVKVEDLKYENSSILYPSNDIYKRYIDKIKEELGKTVDNNAFIEDLSRYYREERLRFKFQEQNQEDKPNIARKKI